VGAVVGVLAGLIALRASARLLPAPPPQQLSLATLGFGALATATCAADGRTPAEAILRGLASAGAVLIAMGLTQHPGRPAPDDSPDA
jgi:peptidoglycan/LPS O-acetylase OafA/YrhL